MSFFGLTALGYQNPFQAAHKGSTTLSLFPDNDVDAAIDRTTGGRDVHVGDLELFFEKLFYGPLYSIEQLEQVRSAFGERESLTKQEFFDVVVGVRDSEADETERRRNVAVENVSIQELNAAKKKGAKLKYAPNQKYEYPLTASHQIGWSANENYVNDEEQRFPKIASEESRFQDKMVEYGVF